MKNIILQLFFFLLFTFSSYGQKYIIKGTLSDSSFNNQYILLVKGHLPLEKKTIIDSAKIKNNKFSFKGKAKGSPFLSCLMFRNQPIPAHFIIEPGKINIIVNNEGLNVYGTPLNDEYYKTIIAPHQKIQRADSLGDKRRKAIREGIWTQDDEINYRLKLPHKQMQIARKKRWEYIESHIQDPEIIFLQLYTYYKLQDPKIKKILPELSDSIIKRIEHHIKIEKEAIAEYIQKHGLPKSKIIENIPENIQVGQSFTDFTGIAPDGKKISLSEVIKDNKLVLIDFWASWCDPCMQEMSNLTEIYKQYKDKGLQIIGISSDQNEQQWTATIEKKNMDWLHIKSIKKDQIQAIYSVKFIPLTILINHDGKIIARDLQGEELSQKIKEILH